MNNIVYASLLLCCCLLLVTGPAPGEAANILFFFGITTYSHRISVWPLVEKLVDEGHSVTFVSAHEPKALKNPKVKEVRPQAYQDFYRMLMEFNLLEMRLHGDHRDAWENIARFGLQSTEMLTKDEEFLKWTNSEKFDYVFVDSLFAEVGMALAWKYRANFAVFCTTAMYAWQFDAFGFVPETSWLPDLQMHYEEDMDLWTRVWNTWNPIRWHLYKSYVYYPQLRKTIAEGLGIPDLPDMEQLEKNVSLVLSNIHHGEEYGRALPPLVVPIGGMHCFNSKGEASKDLQAFMDSSGPEGFMYVSFGSALQFAEMQPRLRSIFFNAMSKSKTKFIVKWEGDKIEGMPVNAYYSSWLPQQKILAHPNIKGFITHGGLLGLQEAVCFAVPLVIFAIFAEQDYNGNRHSARGRGIKLEFKTLTEDELSSAISRLLTDPSYKKNMERASQLFLERPQKPLELAMWWTNYSLKHGHVPELKSLGLHQPWYQRRLIDVYFVVFAAISAGFCLIVGILVMLLKCACSRKSSWSSLKDSKKKRH